MSETCCNRHNNTARTAQDILLFRQKEQIFFLRPCVPVWLPEGYTQYYEKDLS